MSAAVVGLLGGIAAVPAAAQPTVLAVPTVTGVSPSTGPGGGGTAVFIFGTNFDASATVKFGTAAATGVTFVSSTELQATSPAGTGKVDVTVTTTGGTSATSSLDKFSYLPAVTGVSPSFGPPAGGTMVTITGNNFDASASVKFGTAAATGVTFVSSTKLTATSPAGPVGATVDVTVTTTGGTSPTTVGDQFSYNTKPTVSGVSPSFGPGGGGTVVTIFGSHFDTTATVKFGTAAATGTVTFVSSTELRATSPAGTGTVDVTVTTTAGGTSATNPQDKFSYLPAVTGVSPSFGPAAGGTAVTITGTNFDASASVKFGTAAATGVTFVSSTKLTATSPAGTGTVHVTVTTAGGTSATTAADQFSYSTLPTVSSVSPSFGPGAGGTAVTINGTHFTSGATVKFGTAAATGVTFVSSTQLKATSPAGTGTVDVTVTTGGGTSAITAGDKFSYLPAVTGVSPSDGPAAGGTVVTITGTNFDASATVKFGTAAASGVTFVSSTKLTATSPAGTIGTTVDVTVTTAGGTSATTAADKFSYSTLPTVSSVSPSFGPGAGGTTVTITGKHFTSGATVKFGTAAAVGPVTFVSSTVLKATSPVGTGTVDVTVTTAGGTSAITAGDKFSYLPAVTGVSPSFGPGGGGTVVTITGTNFDASATVNFGANPATGVTFVSSTKITATSPAGTIGTTVDVTVTTAGGTSATTAADKFSYSTLPTVSSVSPSFGPGAGGTTVTITGKHFTSGATVKFGTAAATGVTFVSSTVLKATSPAGTGTVDVTVTTAAGTSATNPQDKFSYLPTVTGVSPSFGPPGGGTAVTITGTNFDASATVNFGTNPGTSVTFVSSTKITATSPAGTGTVDVTVTTTGGTSATTAADKFDYATVPTVSSVSPQFGPGAGGTTVTITGKHFTNGATVNFGTTAATGVTFVSSTQLQATSPAGTGTVDVTVTTTGGTSATNTHDKFSYLPTVTGVSPSSGPLAGGTVVTITGTNFDTSATVNFGATAATGVTFISSTQLQATSPAGTGKVDVTVTTAGGTSAISSLDKFSYNAVPTVTGVSPSSGPAAGGTTVTVTGTHFTSTATVNFGATAATGVTFVSSTQLKATSPAGTSGTTVDVTVTTTGGTSATTAGDKYSYI